MNDHVQLRCSTKTLLTEHLALAMDTPLEMELFISSIHLEEGSLVVLAGVGVVRIESLGDAIAVIGGEDEPYEIRAESAPSKMRALATTEIANQALGRFSKLTAPVPKDKRSRVYRKAHKSADLIEMSETLASIYSKKTSDFLDDRYRSALEKAVFEELAAILGTSIASLKRSARKNGISKSGIKGDQPRYLDAPDRNDILAESLDAIDSNAVGRISNSVGAIYVEDSLIVGEMAKGLTLTARPGAWLVYVNSVDQDQMETIIAVHHQCIDLFFSLPQKEAKDVLPIDGASMAVTDAWFAEDPDLLRDLEAGEESIAGRSISIGIGGDGSANVRYREIDGRAVHVEIELR